MPRRATSPPLRRRLPQHQTAAALGSRELHCGATIPAARPQPAVSLARLQHPHQPRGARDGPGAPRRPFACRLGLAASPTRALPRDRTAPLPALRPASLRPRGGGASTLPAARQPLPRHALSRHQAPRGSVVLALAPRPPPLPVPPRRTDRRRVAAALPILMLRLSSRRRLRIRLQEGAQYRKSYSTQSTPSATSCRRPGAA